MTKTAMENATDVNNPHSISAKMRNRRHLLFEKFTASIPHPIKIIDIGGTEQYWTARGYANRKDIEILAVNLQAKATTCDNIQVVKGDATNLPEYGNKQFDIAFSNSVIEHLFTLSNQHKMATEVKRVAKAYWVQTPNYWFPMEPHFHLPGWQWLPRTARIAILRRFRCGRRGPCRDYETAARHIDEVRLMSRRELIEAFPGAKVWRESFWGLTKSFVVHDGFGQN